MDSLSQLTLGAAVGEAVLGRKVGNKAILWGAIAGTIPDLDVFAAPLMNTVQGLLFHRSMTHSITFSILAAPLFGWLVYKLYKKRGKEEASWRAWSWLFFWALVTHPLLDNFTNWGTQFFWPFSHYRVAFNTIFIVDPLYTVPFLITVIVCLFLNRKNSKRRIFNFTGLTISTLYLAFTVFNKQYIDSKFEKSLSNQNIAFEQFMTNPTPLNNILWYGMVKTDENFLLGYYSLMDKEDHISFIELPRNEEDFPDLQQNKKIKLLEFISKGYYNFKKQDDHLYFNDLRFGLMNAWEDGPPKYAFSYLIKEKRDGTLKIITRSPREEGFKKEMFTQLYKRMIGQKL